jgi:hypothetical protein
MINVFQRIRLHFLRRAEKSKWAFLWRTWLEAVALAYLVGNLAQLIAPAAPRFDLINLAPGELVAMVLVVGPLFETLAFQCMPWEFAKSHSARRSIRLAFSVIPFALAHHIAGFPTVVSAGLVGGSYFAFTYERWRKESLFIAVVMTFLLHASFNLVGVLGMLLLPH